MASDDPAEHFNRPTLAEEAGEAWDQARLYHYAAIGLVAANWAYFEAVVDDWTIRLANIPVQIGACFTAQVIGPTRKLDAFMAIIGLMQITEPSVETLKSFCGRATGLGDKRNRIAHDHWDLSNPYEPKRFQVTAKRQLRLEMIPVSTDDLNRLATAISKATEEFEALATQALSAPRVSSPETPPL